MSGVSIREVIADNVESLLNPGVYPTDANKGQPWRNRRDGVMTTISWGPSCYSQNQESYAVEISTCVRLQTVKSSGHFVSGYVIEVDRVLSFEDPEMLDIIHKWVKARTMEIKRDHSRPD